jgi:hypothetical protein
METKGRPPGPSEIAATDDGFHGMEILRERISDIAYREGEDEDCRSSAGPPIARVRITLS